ncbi:MAG: hypothetical protein ABIG08_02335 [bacterium]
MKEDIIIPNPENLEEVKKLISKAGVEKIHVLSDFDRTLTQAFVNGKSVPSLISILRDENCLAPDYIQKLQELYDKYHPIEVNPGIPLEEKKKLMREWWQTVFGLLIESGLNRKHLQEVANSQKIKPREGFAEFVDFLKAHNIPLVIMSSSGLGGENIAMYLEKEGKLRGNIHIISNSFQWDEKGNAIGVKEPIIHVMNKDETLLRDFPAFEAVKNRKNVLLLGDGLGDVGMVEGFDYDNLIKIGFLNENMEDNLPEYKLNYDVIILNDGSFDRVNSLLEEMFL